MSCGVGVPGITGSSSPKAPLEEPLVVPSLLRASEPSCRLRLGGGCFAADERLRRWPALAEKDVGEATATECIKAALEARKGQRRRACQGRGARGTTVRLGPRWRKGAQQPQWHPWAKARRSGRWHRAEAEVQQ